VNFSYEPTEFVLNLQGRRRAWCIWHQCIRLNIRLFTTILKGEGQFCYQCIGISDMFYSCLRKVRIRFWQWFPLASQNLSCVTKTFFIARLISAGEVEHTALLVRACRLL